MRKLIIVTFLLICCASSLKNQPHFYSDNLKDGYSILKIYNWQLIRIDTVTKPNKTFIFYYKDLDKE